MPKMSTIFVLTLIACSLAAGVPGAAYGQTADGAPLVTSQAPSPAPLAKPVPVQQGAALALGLQQYKLGNYEEAFDALTTAREQDPGSAAAAYYLGVTLKKMQQLDKAIPELLASVTLQPPVKEGFLELADAYYATDRFDEALQALNVAGQERLDPGQVEFLRALVFVKKKKYPEAAAGFEKAKAADRKLANEADFQIATIRQRLGQQLEARDLFKSIADRAPGSDTGIMAKQQADDLTKQMEKKYVFNASANAQYQYDSNVILKPDAASAGTESISGEKDTAAVLALRAEFAPALALPYSLKFQYNGYLNAHQKLKAYDVQSHTLGVVPGYRMGENSAALPITYSYTLVDSQKYLNVLGLTPTYSFVTGMDQFAVATIKYQKKDYLKEVLPGFEADNRDSTDVGAGISWSRLIAQQKGYANIRYELNKENAEGANWSYLGHKLGAGALYPLTDAVKLSLGIEMYRQVYDNVSTIFTDIKRTDTSYMGSAQFLYALTQDIDAQAQYTAMKTDSTISVYGYSKNIISIGLSARF